MSHNFFCVSTAFLFGGLGLLVASVEHFGWEITVNGLMFPSWLNWTVVGLAFIMAFVGLHHVR